MPFGGGSEYIGEMAEWSCGPHMYTANGQVREHVEIHVPWDIAIPCMSEWPLHACAGHVHQESPFGV